MKWVYHIGVIDYLQDYHFEKQAENFLKEKVLQRGSMDNEISAVHPIRYAPRFINFMATHVITSAPTG